MDKKNRNNRSIKNNNIDIKCNLQAYNNKMKHQINFNLNIPQIITIQQLTTAYCNIKKTTPY